MGTKDVCFLVNIAFNICTDNKLLAQELNYIRSIATNRVYPVSVVNNAIRKFRNKQNIRSTTTLTSLKETKTSYAIIPFIPSLSHKIGAVFNKVGIKPVYKPVKKTCDIFNNHKTKITADNKSGIYSIPCSDCNHNYIGQTKRNFSTRLKEHVRASGFNPLNKSYNPSKAHPENSAVAEHHINTGHEINWTSAKIIKPSPPYLLNSYEKLFIHINKPTMNRQDDDKLPNVWRNLLPQPCIPLPSPSQQALNVDPSNAL